jgi:hypothetical protein
MVPWEQLLMSHGRACASSWFLQLAYLTSIQEWIIMNHRHEVRHLASASNTFMRKNRVAGTAFQLEE